MSHLLPVLLSAATLIPQEPDPGTDDAAPATVAVRFDDLRGRIVAIDGDQVRVEFSGSSRSTATLPKDAIPADTLYLWRRANRSADDAEAWLQLAEFAHSHELHVRCMDALQKAAARAPDDGRIEQRIARVREECASARLETARSLREEGELRAATEELKAIVRDFGSTDAAEGAGELLDTIRSRRDDERTRATSARLSREQVLEQNPRLEDAAEAIQRGKRLLRHGLENLDDLVDSKNAFEHALAWFERARDRLEDFASDRDGDVSTAARSERERLSRLAKRAMVRAHVELGYVYLGRGDEQSARKHVGQAAALGPSDVSVGRLRQAIGSRDGF